MSRALSVLLAVLLVLAGVTPAAVGGISPPKPEATTPVEGISPNTANVLVLDEIGRSNIGSSGLSVTKSVAADASGLESRFDVHALDAAYEAARTAPGKRRVLVNATRSLEAAVADLRAREQAARRAYLAGSMSGREFVTTLALLDARADALSTKASWIADHTASGSSLQNRVYDVEASLAAIQGPVRDAAADVMRGGDRSLRIFIAASQNGVTLAMIETGTYVRETLRADNADDAVDPAWQFDPTEIPSEMSQFYPWAVNNSDRFDARGIGNDAFRAAIVHSHGQVIAFVDPSTNRIYREIQYKTLDLLPAETVRNVSKGNVTLSVSDTYAGGPLRVRVTNSTGAPLDAAVAVNGTAIGRTGPDGTVWALSPAGTYPVNATHEGTRVGLNVTATEG